MTNKPKLSGTPASRRPKGKSTQTTGLPSEQLYKFVQRDRYLTVRNEQRQRYKAQSSGRGGRAKNKFMLKRWNGYADAHLKMDNPAGVEIKTSSRAGVMQPAPETVQTVEIEFHPSMTKEQTMQNLVKLSTAEQMQFFDKQQLSDDARSEHTVHHGQNISKQLMAEADRCITEVFEVEEVNKTVRQGTIDNGVFVVHTHEEVTTTRTAITRNIFKFMVYNIAKAKGQRDAGKIRPEDLSPLVQNIIKGSKDQAGKQAKQAKAALKKQPVENIQTLPKTRPSGQPLLQTGKGEPSAVAQSDPASTGKAPPSETSMRDRSELPVQHSALGREPSSREPSQMDPAMSIPEREPSAREPSLTGSSRTVPSELSMRQPSETTSSVPGREPSEGDANTMALVGPQLGREPSSEKEEPHKASMKESSDLAPIASKPYRVPSGETEPSAPGEHSSLFAPPSVPGRETSAREPSTLGATPAAGQEPSQREPSIAEPSAQGEPSPGEHSALFAPPSVPGREPSARELSGFETTPSLSGKKPSMAGPSEIQPSAPGREPSEREQLPLREPSDTRQAVPAVVSPASQQSKSTPLVKQSSSTSRQTSVLLQPVSMITIKSITLPTKTVTVVSSGKKALHGSDATIVHPVTKKRPAVGTSILSDSDEPAKAATIRPLEYSGDTDEKQQMTKANSLTGFRSENPNQPMLPQPGKRLQKGETEGSAREPEDAEAGIPGTSGREPKEQTAGTSGPMEAAGREPQEMQDTGTSGSGGREPSFKEPSATQPEMMKPSELSMREPSATQREPSTREPSAFLASPSASGQDPSAREPSAIGAEPSVPGRKSSLFEPSMMSSEPSPQGRDPSSGEHSALFAPPSIPGRGSSDREPSTVGSELSAQGREPSPGEDSALFAPPSVPGRDPSAQQPSVFGTAPSAPGRVPITAGPAEAHLSAPGKEPNAREPRLTDAPFTKFAELSSREPISHAQISSSTAPSSEPFMRHPTGLSQAIPQREPNAFQQPVFSTGSEAPTSKREPQGAAPLTIPSSGTATSTEAEPRTIIFRPTIIIIQNVFTIPAELLAQLNLSGADLQSLVTVQNQEVLIYPNTVPVSYDGLTVTTGSPATSQAATNSSSSMPPVRVLPSGENAPPNRRPPAGPPPQPRPPSGQSDDSSQHK